MKQSLRDIKREATAHALAQAAFELARERGMDGFVVEDVVQRAGYSRRTFANHYACKEEAVAMAALAFGEVDEAEVLNMPPDTVPLEALHRWLRMQFTAELLWKMRELVSLSRAHPSLEPYILSVTHGLQTEARAALSGLFKDRYPEGYFHILIGAVFGAILPILDGSLPVSLPGRAVEAASETTPFEQYLDTVFGYLRHGF